MYEKNLKFFYQNLPQYYKIASTPLKLTIKNDNLFLNNKPIYPNSISYDSMQIASNPIKNPLWKKEFFITPTTWNQKEFFITGKIINSLPKSNKFYFDEDFLPTTMLFGLLSGKHLEILQQKYHFQSLFIYEPNIEFFKASLYYVDYEKLYKKYDERLFLWIGGEIDYFAIEKFFYKRIITSSFLNLYYKAYSHPLIDDAISKFSQVQLMKLRGWGTYEDELKGIKKHQQNINKYPLLSKKHKINAPFCIIANGKSLEKNINFIKKNKNSMILVSVGTALKPLLNQNIEPDFHIEQERIDILPKVLEDTLPKFNGFFIGASVVDSEVFKMAKNPLMFIREAFSLQECYHALFGSSPIVGNAGFAFGANYTNEIYLCGMDLGFKLGSKKHASGSFYDSYDDIAKNGIKVKGNFDNFVYTDSLFLTSKDKIEKMIEIFNLKVYNLSYGAYIKNTIPLKDKTLPPINKKEIIKKILSTFENKKNPPCITNNKELIEIIKKALNLSTNNQKEVTGMVDFIEDIIKAYAKKDNKTYMLLKGSLFHIFSHFYALSFTTNPTNLKTSLKNKLDLFSK